MNELEVHISFIRRIFKGLHQVLDKSYHVRFSELKYELTLINFSDVHQLVYESQNTFGIPVHDLVHVGFLRIGFAGNEFFERTDNQTHRSSDFM